MNTFFIVCLAVGLVGIVGTLIVGEVGSDLGEVGSSGDGLPFLGLTTLATASLGLGTGGGVAALLGAGDVAAVVAAIVTALALVFLTRGLLVPYLLRQQANSHTGRQGYVGRIGIITLPIEPGGWGEVAFTDVDGSRVRSRAVSAEREPLPVNSRVYIGEVDEDALHVVSIPDDPATTA